MRLSAPAKLAVLFLTVLPLVYMALFLASIAFIFRSAANESLLVGHFGTFIAIHLAVMLLMFGLLAFYIVFLFKTPDVRTDMKALWAIVIFMGGPIAMPIFWYLHIWREGSAA